ncbi:MAG TPA: tyrosine--tRNA ligase [Candidatus Saccharimonadales bacterium]|nr:tyrosine--tRNA ligase [Candidatus Saccharimonadales bacterium]
MNISEDLSKRGLIKDHTFDDLTWLDKAGRKFYLGIDASSDSLTIGNLAVILLARRLLEAGWKAVLLAGGATSLVGDPGGKEEERDLKSREEIAANVKGVQAQIEKLFGGQPHELVNNIDWLDKLNYLDFLREVGKHYSMTELVQRDFVASRLGGAGISYAEFSYSLLQGYDFWWLFKNKDVIMQIGASDQWGNMLSGVPLIRKKEGKEVHAFSMPLVINKETGVKFGKSEAGAVWLDPARTSPTQFYQFWINASDEEVGDFLKIYTMLPLERIQEIMEYHVSSPEERKAQLALAREVTELVHGKEEAHKAAVVTDVLTGKTSVAEISEGVLAEVRKELPSEKFTKAPTVVDALAATGLASSKSEARRLLLGGAVYLNGEKVADDTALVTAGPGRHMLRRGKAFKDSALIEIK